ncbi:esterase FE4-like [Cydia strobilella]|uniref:esterase FE4-like n=1 Tax=Cydia strobilella TaxID=1100964 RepID=UPI0030048C1E
MRRDLLIIVLTVYGVSGQDARESRVVKTAQGPVRGYKYDEIFEFYGIPYATAPTGANKFQAPLPGPVWIQPLDAVNDKIICHQGSTPEMPIDFSSYSMQEDCLIANVLIPDTEEKNLPVMVYVHGGAYQLGSGNTMSQKSLVKSKKIVAVNFNYRLGIHGFLCLGTEGAPGNAGMKDQVALLLWVKKNIANFGGNPNDVTLVGSSAGSSAVDLLMLSEKTKGLYNKAIPESGAGVGVWSIQIDPMQTAKDFAKANNFTKVDNIRLLEEFYKRASFDLLTSDVFLGNKDSSFSFVPCVERNIGVETFLEDSPVNILKQGKYKKVPVLYGFANLEGYMRMYRFDEWSKQMNERFSDFLPADLQFKDEEERDKVAQVIKEFYFGNKAVGLETVQSYVDYFSDIMFVYPHLRSVKLQVEAGSDSLYLYEYTFHSTAPFPDNAPTFIKQLKGAPHCAQSVAVHDIDYDIITVDASEEYSKTRKTLRDIWLSFITTGNPAPEGSNLPPWPSANADRSPHMELGEEIKLKGPLLELRARFWDDIYDRYYRNPIPPPQPFMRSEL